MKPRFPLYFSFWAILLLAALVSCDSNRKTIHLITFTENDVHVTIDLINKSNKEYVLEATFTPPNGYHLYSKDIPVAGVDGLGRPTLLELTPNSLMKATGSLIESEKPQTPDFGPLKLLVYPSGPATLSLPVTLPAGDQWMDDEIAVTYMACSASKCKPPVENRIVPIRIPGADAVDSK